MTTETPPAPAPQGTPNPDPNPTPNPAPNPDPNPAPPPGAPNPDTAPNPNPNPPPTTFSEKWREDFAGDDTKMLARMQRYATPKDALTALVAAQNKIADGSFKKGLSDKATPEEITEYRKQNGIPEKAEDYFAKLPDGLVIGDEDKALFDDFAKSLHGVHADPKVAQTAAKWYYELQDKVAAQQHEANVKAKAETEDAMRAEWGPDYRPNINLVDTYVKTMPQDLQDMLYKSTTADGKQIMNSPLMMQWLASQARELNYTGTTLPTGESNAQSIDAEIAGFKAKMGDRTSDYWKGPSADKNQARYRELLDLKTRLASRAA